jgi:hypothetical protein
MLLEFHWQKMNTRTMMYGYVEYSKNANNNCVITFIHSNPQELLLATDICVISSVVRENAIHNACTRLALLNVKDSQKIKL